MASKNFAHQLDDKNRMRIPAKLRETLGDSYTIMIGTPCCLYVLPKEESDKLRAKFRALNPYRERELKAARRVLASMSEVVEDNQGRFVLNDDLRKFAKIEKNIKVYQGPTYIEIWSEEEWDNYFGEPNFDDLADALDELNGTRA